jgi:hypothetical protein
VHLSEPTRSADGSVCVTDGSLRVCRKPIDGGGLVVASREGRETGQWAASYPGVFDDLRVARLGEDRLMVAVLDGVSNGIAIATWTLYFTDGDSVAYRFVVRDFDPEGGSFGLWNRQHVLWATEWHASEDPTGRRGPGTYIVGRPFRLGPNGLVPVTGLPIRARRLLFSFERAMGGPVQWLSDRRAETRHRDPFWSGRPSGTRGVISAVNLGGETPGVTVRAGDQIVDLRLDAWGGGAGTGRFGDAASGRLFPPDYVTTNLQGHSVRLGPGPDDSVILWLD